MGGHKRLDLLWVEDDNEFLNVARRMLPTGGSEAHKILPWAVQIHHEKTLKGALAQLHSAPPDLVVLDLHLPDSTGADTLAAIRQALPEAPILVLTGSRELEAGLTAGLYNADFLHKDDVSTDSLWRTILMALARPRLAVR